MQFIPPPGSSTADPGDRKADPQQIVDATAHRALPVRSRSGMATGQGWWDGVLSYNHSVEYGRKVFALAEHYAELAQSFTG